MHVDVQLLWRNGDIQDHDGVLAGHEQAMIGVFGSPGQQAAAYPAAVDEEAQIPRVERAREGGLTSPVTLGDWSVSPISSICLAISRP